jgi:hypothetical protein
VQGNGKGHSAPAAACIDAETLAAWADGGLPKAEAAAVEVHHADCERCTAMLATFVRTTPEAAITESLWQRWHLRWLVPIATAATVAALWVLVPRPGSAPVGEPESAVATSAPAATPAVEQPSPSADAQPKELADATPRSASRPSAALPSVTPPSTQADAFARRDETKAAPLEPRLAERERTLQEPAPEADQANPRTTQLQTAAPPPAADARSAPAAPAPASPLAEARRQANTAFAGVVAQLEVRSPDPMTRWRVIGAGRVERTTNGGAQWVQATLPESATLTGGSSPAPSICWLVGRTGAIYMTTDGLRFTKVPFESRTDFISIQALDARRATVITSDGRTMRTEDQGATWIRVSP